MYSTGVRDLKARLSEYLRRVRAGERVLVTDRGKVVAELAPPGAGAAAASPAVAALAGRGTVRIGAPNHPDLYRSLAPVLVGTDSRALLDAERGER